MLAAQYLIDQLSLPLVGVVDATEGSPTAVVMKSQVEKFFVSLVFESKRDFFVASLDLRFVCMEMRR